MSTPEQAARDWVLIADNLRTQMAQTVLGLQHDIDTSSQDDYARAQCMLTLADTAWHIASLDVLARTFEARVAQKGY